MSIMYVVKNGYYSDTKNVGVFDDPVLAQRCAELYTESYIETFELNKLEHTIPDGYYAYSVSMERDGEVYYCEKTGLTRRWERLWFIDNYDESRGKELFMIVYARDEDHAVKIVNERRLFLIANNEWEE